MDKIKVAEQLIKLADMLDEEQSAVAEVKKPATLKQNVSGLNAVSQKLVDATGGDVAKMLTVIVMALKASGHAEESTKIYNLFKGIMTKVQKIM